MCKDITTIINVQAEFQFIGISGPLTSLCVGGLFGGIWSLKVH